MSANKERVDVGDNITLTCLVIRGNPMNYKFEWFHEGFSSATTSTMDSFNNLNYPSFKDNDVGMYTCSVTNGIGSAATSSLNITLGGMYNSFHIMLLKSYKILALHAYIPTYFMGQIRVE